MTEKNPSRPNGGVVQTIDGDEYSRNGHESDTDTAAASKFAGEDLIIGYPSTDEPVIDGESIRIAPGKVTALIGPNGSGKSTLLKGLANQLALNDGTVLLDGKEIHTLGTKELARKLGLLSQENVSPDSITVEKLVEHGRYPHRGFFASLTNEDQQAIDRAISLAELITFGTVRWGALAAGRSNSCGSRWHSPKRQTFSSWTSQRHFSISTTSLK